MSKSDARRGFSGRSVNIVKTTVKLMAFAVAVIASLQGYAFDFTVGQLNYTVLSEEDGTVEVSSTTKEYDSEITVPATVDNDGKTYTVVELGYFAFNNHKELTAVNLPATIESIGIRGSSSFNNCLALESINVDGGNPTFASADGIVFDKNMSRVVICPGGKTSVNIPNTVTTIGASSFRECRNLVSVKIPHSVTVIETYAFSFCDDLTDVVIPESVTSIGEYAFAWCKSLVSFMVPANVSVIKEGILAGCAKLESVTLPASVKDIEWNAFGSCPSLKSLEMLSETPPECDPSFREDIYSNVTLYVPVGAKDAYEAVEPWKNFAHIEERDFSGVEELETAVGTPLSVVVNNGTVTVCVLDPGEEIEVYDMAGRMIYSGSEHTVAGLAKGVYVVKSGARTAKFAL